MPSHADNHKYLQEVTALASVLLGALIILAPLALASVIPNFCQSVVSCSGGGGGTTGGLAGNQILGGLFVIVGVGVFIGVNRRRRS